MQSKEMHLKLRLQNVDNFVNPDSVVNECYV